MLDARPVRRPSGDLFVRSATASLYAYAHNEFVTDIIKRHYADDRSVEPVTKAAVSPATITGSGWADPLAMTVNADFFLNIGGASAFSAVAARCLSLKFNGATGIKVPVVTTSATGAGFVQEAAPIPVRILSIGAGVTLLPRTFATICVFSRDIFEHSVPGIEGLVRQVVTEDIGLAADSYAFDATAGDAVRPAGLLNSIVATSPSAAGDWAMINDVETLAAAVAPTAGNNQILFVASPKQAVRMQISSQLRNVTVFASSALADKTVLCLASNCLVSALDASPRFEVRDAATLVLRDDPTAFGTVGSPATVGAPARSLWQGDEIGLKIKMEVAWALRSATGLAYMNAVNW
jgi:hypothetical protein